MNIYLACSILALFLIVWCFKREWVLRLMPTKRVFIRSDTFWEDWGNSPINTYQDWIGLTFVYEGNPVILNEDGEEEFDGETYYFVLN